MVGRLLKAQAAVGGVILIVGIAAVAGSAGAGGCSPSATGPVAGPPAQLVPIYQTAAAKYGLGPQGPAVLAAINYVETDFGQNLSTSSAGAVGWMQFEPGTWARYGVTPDGSKAPFGPAGWNNPADAIFSAANYLHASGAPADWQAAVLIYNHSQAYVSQVLSLAQTYYTSGLHRGSTAYVSTVVSSTCTGVTINGYVNPFAHSTNLVPQRIDMGVDYDGSGAIDALGAARITYADADPGWAGGNSVNYQLLDGPYAGRNVYVAEAVMPTVTTGQTVSAGQPIATFGHGFSSNSIETGWASGRGRPAALANQLHQADYNPGQDIGSYRTFCGQQFSDLLHALGAPGGLENHPLSGNSCN
ncbi:MAG: lytic transglycosylase domain-containing protein [Solirubrobacteraceae bacterium]